MRVRNDSASAHRQRLLLKTKGRYSQYYEIASPRAQRAPRDGDFCLVLVGATVTLQSTVSVEVRAAPLSLHLDLRFADDLRGTYMYLGLWLQPVLQETELQ